LAVIDQGELQAASHHGLLNPEKIIQSSHVKSAVRKHKPQIITIPSADAVVVDHIVGQHTAKNVLAYPILYKGISLGVIVLVGQNPYETEVLRRLDLLSVGLGLALNNSLTHGRMKVLATLDPLTEVYNRGFGAKRLHEEYSRSVRSGSPLGLIIFDIDDFKGVNDTFGHLAGDRILITVVNTTKNMLREGDILVRYGGEEFMAVLPGASLNDVTIVGERIRRAIKNLTIMEGKDIVKVTVSLGGVSYPELNVTSDEALLQHADTSLYLAKNSGKDKMEIRGA
jgi:diguanylate cyclase (GGDEF)-like protein